MVEKTPILDTFTYIFLMLGILLVGFPIIYAIIAATLPIEDVSRVPMPMIPGDQFMVNMQTAWEKGDLGTQLINSFIMAVRHYHRQNHRIHAGRIFHRLFRLPVSDGCVYHGVLYIDAACRGQNPPHLRDGSQRVRSLQCSVVGPTPGWCCRLDRRTRR